LSKETSQSGREPRRTDNIIRFTSMATQMGITIFLGVWGGMKLDKIFPQRVPIFTLILSLAGVVIAIYMVIKDVLKKK
jgi:F0F1-type ATP synthase assembly protein I